MTYKFLIYISYSYAIPTGLPLEKEILKNGYRVKWFGERPEGQNAIPESSEKFKNIQEVIAYRPDIILCITDDAPYFVQGIKVQVFHGFNAEKRSFKKDHFRIRGFFDLYCTQGPSTTSVFLRQQKRYKTFDVIETGWSKVDPLFPITENPHRNPPVVFIASTFTPRLSLALNNEVYEKIASLAEQKKYRFLMVLHPKLSEDVVNKWKKLESDFFRFYDTTDLIPLFKQADIMFSDTTSAIQEFGLQGRPIVTFSHYRPKPYLINVTEVSEIETTLDYALTYPEKIINELATFNQSLHPYRDGKSSKRIMEACIEFLHKDKTHLKRKPLNFVRKLKIGKRLDYYLPHVENRPYTIPNKDHIPLTAIIPVGNEIHNIEGVIASVAFADEILVVDSLSNDGTYEKALELADRVIRREYQYSASQKNWAIPQAKHEWVLLVDADERVTEELKNEILDVLRDPPKDVVGFWIGRMNHFMGKRVKHSGWRNDKVIRLFQKDKCRYKDKKVHSEIIADGKVGKLKSKFYHNTYITLDRHLEKMNRYAWWQAKDYDKITGRLTGFHFFLKPMWSFFKHYIIQGGFRDGVVGITIAYIQAYTVFMRYAKLWLLRKNRQ